MIERAKCLISEHSGQCIITMSVPEPGGTASVLPQWDPILSFSCTFLPKSIRIGGWDPPLQREILDSPLDVSYVAARDQIFQK